MREAKGFDVDAHFAGKDEVVRRTYDALLKTMRKRFSVMESPKKTSIHLRNVTTLAGVSTRKSCLILTIKSDCMLSSPRIRKSEHVSRNRFHFTLKLSSPADIDQELIAWLDNAYCLSV